MRAFLICTALVACVDPVTSPCGAPASTTYDCAPVPPGTTCSGGPVRDVPGGTLQDDKDKSFPVGCKATAPECSSLFTGEPQTYNCITFPAPTGTVWVLHTG